MQAKALISQKNFQKTMIRGAVCGVLLGLLGCASQGSFRWPADNPFKGYENKTLSDYSEGRLPFRLVFTSNVLGEVEPCGCAVGPKGGLDRRLNFVKDKVRAQEKQWPYLIVDAGNSILSTPQVDEARVKAYQQVALGIFKASKSMGVAVQNVAYLDLGFGVPFLKQISQESGLPLVSASWIGADNKLIFDATKEFVVGSLSVVVTGVSAGLEGARDDLGLKVRDAEQALGEVLSGVPESSVLIVLSDLGQPREEELALKFGKRNMIFVGARDLGGLSMPKQMGSSVMVQGQFRGQQWGVMDSFYRPKSEGWIWLEKMPYFSNLWANLVAVRDADRARIKNSSELKLEEERHASSAKDIHYYAPKKLETSSVYSYSLVDLGEEYRKTNELSKEMNRLINLRK